MPTCTKTLCFLADKGSVTFPLITIAGIVDGINPCAIWMLVFLLGYLVIFLQKKARILPTALIYIGTVYLTYLVLGLILYKITLSINLSAFKAPFQKFLGIFFLGFSLLTLKDVFFPKVGPSIRIPLSIQGKLKNFAKKATFPTTAIFAVLVTLFEAPCSLPLYAGTAQILSSLHLSIFVITAYYLYYNLLFILPLLIVVGIFIKGVDFLTIEDFTHRAQPKMKGLIGSILLIFSLYFLFF